MQQQIDSQSVIVYAQDKLMLIKLENEDFLCGIQEISQDFYTQDLINKLYKILEADRKVLELLTQKQREEAKKPNVARKTVKPVGSIQINDQSQGVMIGKDNINPKAALIARTQERLIKFGILNLRTCDEYCLKRVFIDDADIKQSPWLQRSEEALKLMQEDPEHQLMENNIITLMKDFLNDDILNPNDEGNVVFD